VKSNKKKSPQAKFSLCTNWK